MAYVVLARKWRPKRFEDVVGQEHITNTLANAISQGRVAHGYLFCGPRGVGKTTTARILAKALNCEKGPTPTPCNVCTTCLDVDLGRSMDIIEVDGASTRGIDDIRELRENVRYAPTSGRTKVYIIDEVHMLTREAFNALLKTLEEPPPHVVFVLATTEPFKVPATILSRCQRFDFARIHPRVVASRLAMIVGAEGFKVQPDALALLARRSQGGLRDALSTLDQVLGTVETEVTVDTVNGVLGILGSDFYARLTDHLIAGDAPSALRLLDEVYHAGADLGELAEELARHFRNVMLLTVGPGMESVLDDLGPAEVARFRKQAGELTPTAAARLLETALRTINLARRGEHLRLHLEVAMVELASISRMIPLAEVVQRLDEMERRLGSGAPDTGARDRQPRSGSAEETATRRGPAPAPPSRPAPSPPPQSTAAPSPPASGPSRPSMPPGLREPAALAGNAPAGDRPLDTAEIPELWKRLTAEVKNRKMSIGAFLIGSRCDDVDPEGRLIVQVDAAHAFYKTNLEADENRRFIEGVIREIFGRTCRYVVEVGGGETGGKTRRDAVPAPVAEPPGAGPEAPPERKAPESPARPVAPPRPAAPPAETGKSAFEIAQSDENVQRVMELFDGEVTT